MPTAREIALCDALVAALNAQPALVEGLVAERMLVPYYDRTTNVVAMAVSPDRTNRTSRSRGDDEVAYTVAIWLWQPVASQADEHVEPAVNVAAAVFAYWDRGGPLFDARLAGMNPESVEFFPVAEDDLVDEDLVTSLLLVTYSEVR